MTSLQSSEHQPLFVPVPWVGKGSAVFNRVLFTQVVSATVSVPKAGGSFFGRCSARSEGRLARGGCPMDWVPCSSVSGSGGPGRMTQLLQQAL